MSMERQTKKEMFEFSTKSSESRTLSDITWQTVLFEDTEATIA